MASIVYALCGHGRGHQSRALAVAAALRRAGHSVRYKAGGDAYRSFSAQGEPVDFVPTLRQVIRGNRVRLLETAWVNTAAAFRSPDTIRGLTERLEAERPDLVISDFEPFTPRAARRLGIPVVALNHQQILSETRYDIPRRYRLSALGTKAGIAVLAPPRPARIVIPTFFFPPVLRPHRTVLTPPVLRADLLGTTPSNGDHLLVYLNESTGTEPIHHALAQTGLPVRAYGLAASLPPDGSSQITHRSPSRDGFLRDLASCRAVVSTAGFTLLSEALHLGKPVLALPNRGFFEQTLNALYLRRSGGGDAILDRMLTPSDLPAFLDRFSLAPPQSRTEGERGALEAVAAVERVLDGQSAGALATVVAMPR